MRVIAIAQQKGGVSKSTLAIHIAAEAVSRGLNAVVLELDKQGTSSFWRNQRAMASGDRGERNVTKPPQVIQHESAKVADLLNALTGLNVDLAILDLPGAHNASIGPAIKIADFVLIPARPQETDLSASAETLATVQRLRKPYAYVLTFVEGRGADRADEAREALEAEGHAVVPTGIGRRQVFADAISSGRTVFEMEPKGKAAGEIRDLCKWINEKIDGEINAEASGNAVNHEHPSEAETRH